MEELFVFLTSQQGWLAYAIVFSLLVIAGLGLPISEDLPVIASGYLAWQGTMSFGPAFAVIAVGVLIGDSFLYLVGSKLGGRLLRPSGGRKPLIPPRRVRRTRAYFRRFGDRLIFIARFLPGFRAPTFLIAGALGTPYRRFITYDAAAASLSIPLWLGFGFGLGHWFGAEIARVLESIQEAQGVVGWIALTVAALLVARLSWGWWKGRTLRAAVKSLPDPKDGP